MKLAAALLAILVLMPWTGHAVAQQYYSFEEACRMAGQTTGPCAPKTAQEKSLGCVKLTGNAFHADKVSGGECIKTALSPVIDAEIFIEMIGIPNVSKINELGLTIGRSPGFENAVATFHNGSRVIVLDPGWAKSGTAEAYLVLGHEAGHHFCGHTLGGDPFSRKKRELEADRFSGAAIRNFEIYHSKAFYQDVLAAADRLYSATESSSHPSKEARLEAISLGYNEGFSCGGLLTGIAGYSPGPR